MFQALPFAPGVNWWLMALWNATKQSPYEGWDLLGDGYCYSRWHSFWPKRCAWKLFFSWVHFFWEGDDRGWWMILDFEVFFIRIFWGGKRRRFFGEGDDDDDDDGLFFCFCFWYKMKMIRQLRAFFFASCVGKCEFFPRWMRPFYGIQNLESSETEMCRKGAWNFWACQVLCFCLFIKSWKLQ